MTKHTKQGCMLDDTEHVDALKSSELCYDVITDLVDPLFPLTNSLYNCPIVCHKYGCLGVNQINPIQCKDAQSEQRDARMQLLRLVQNVQFHVERKITQPCMEPGGAAVPVCCMLYVVCWFNI